MADVTRLLIVDDQTLYREGLCELFSHWAEFSVIGDVCNGEEAVSFCRRSQPDLILMDVQMPVMDGVEAVKIICEEHPNIIVTMLTVSSDDKHIFGALYNGASGYVLKDTPARRLRSQLHDILKGGGALSGDVTARIIKGLSNSHPIGYTDQEHASIKVDLTARETEILRLVANGLSNEEIGAQLFLSVGTVKKQLSTLSRKLYLENRVQLAVFAVKIGLTD